MEDKAHLNAYLIVGDDPYLVERAQGKLTEGVGEASISVFGPDDDFQMVMQALHTPSMFEDLRFVVLDGIDSFPAEAQRQVVAYLGSPSPGTVLVLTGGKASPQLTAAARSAGRVIDAAKGKRSDLMGWVRQQLTGKGLRSTGEGIAALVDAVGEERTALSQAIEELALALPPKSRVDPARVGEHFRGRADVKVFAFIDAVAQRQAGPALEALHYLLARQEPAQRLFWTLSRYFRMLLIAGESPVSQVAATLGIPSWRAEKLVQQARGFKSDSLVRAYQILAEADLKLKSSVEPEVLTLERAVVAISASR
jgi:DNA polymerase III subunit delta